MLGPQLTAYDQLGHITQRAGNRSENNAPRNTYLTREAIGSPSRPAPTRSPSASCDWSGRADIIDEEWFASGSGGHSTPT